MSKQGNALPGRWAGFAGAALVALFLLAAYANHFQNGFHFDDSHTIENNAAIRDLREIPRFFTDAATFSSLPSNQSYRPLVSTLLAIDYALGGGLHPFWFHVSIFGLFFALTLLLAVVIRGLLNQDGGRPAHGWIALAAAAWYGVHPGNADTVNYIIASGDILSTLGVVASFAVYLAFPNLRHTYLYVLPAAVAILAKPPAAVFPLLFAVYRLMFPARDGDLREPGQTLVSWSKEVIPAVVICGAMVGLVQKMTPRTWIAGAADAHDYLITQPYVALLYLKTFIWPANLSADYDLAAIHTAGDPRFSIGLLFVAVFLAIAVWTSVRKGTRVIGFGLWWFLIALLPTSLLPLAEVMNDHRTFFPYIGLVIAAAGAASIFAMRVHEWKRPVRIACVFAVGVFLCANVYATLQRNKVWRTEETLWRDVTIKSPHNGRGLMNYGNTLMAKGDYAGALDYFHRALAFTPAYSVLFINLGVVEESIGQGASAEEYFKRALQLAPASPVSYTYYARYMIHAARREEARQMLLRALQLSPADLMANELMPQTAAPVAEAQPAESPEDLLALSLHLYRDGRYLESIDACRKALALRPGYAEAWNNIAADFNQLGNYDSAAAACQEALQLNPNFELARNNLQYARAMANALNARVNKAAASPSGKPGL